jgi:phosphatidylserine/phosphatidylglycerophosphate/cardiolipin synthase-like enzyme
MKPLGLIAALAAGALATVQGAWAQSNPTPQAIPYAQNWGTVSFSVMPVGTAAWNGLNGGSITTQAAAEASAPTGNATVTATTGVQTTGGSYGFAQSSNARYYVQTSSNATNGVNQLAVAINTTGYSNIKVSYDVEIISAFTRTVGVVMQYRLGTSGSWTTVAGTGNPYSQSGGTTGVKASPSLTLPAAVDNQPVVQLRWATWRGTEGGSSSGLAIDNISVTSGSSGNGTGVGRVAPTSVFTGQAVPSVAISVSEDQPFTLTDLSVLVPPSWTWSHSLADVALSGAAFASATPSIVGDEIHISGAAVTQTDSGTVTVSNLASPSGGENSTFTLKTAESGGTLTQVVVQPVIRVLHLVPIIAVHVNDASGVCTAPYAVNSVATVSGTCTVNWSGTNTDLYIQDGTAGIDLFAFGAPPITIDPGDSLIVTGTITQFRGLTEITPDFSLVQIVATGRPIPDPLVLTCAGVNATFHADGTEPNEGRLVRVNGITNYAPGSGCPTSATAGTMTDATGSTNIFVPCSYPALPAQFDVIGILKQYKPGTPAPGPPYTADYEVSPRTPDDIIAHPGPILLSVPYEDHIQATSVQIHWTTDVASTSIVHFGTTAALGDSAVDLTPVTNHALTVTGLTPATVYYYSAGSEDGNGRNFSPVDLLTTASAPPATGAMNVYFNKSVDTSLQWLHAAQGNYDLTSQLVSRVNAAQRSIDGAIYNLSGTPGAALANAIVSAKNRGAKVRIICEQDNRSNAPFNTIAAAGIPIISDTFDPINNGSGLMHNKFVVIDNRGGAPDSQWVWTGSWNPTDPGTNDDYQNAIEIQDPALANAYTMEFNEMWGSTTDTPNASTSRFGQRKTDNTPHHFNIGGHDVECYFSPSDATSSHIISEINAAQHTIGFEQLTITYDAIATALVAQKGAGLAVRGDMDNNTDTGSDWTTLVSGGVDVKLKTGSGLLHHKYAIFDAESPGIWDNVTLTGSQNWSGSAETSNDENTLIIHDPDITNQYLQEFVARYHQFGGTDFITLLAVDPAPGVPAGRPFLAQNFPNPALGKTDIHYSLPARGKVVLKLFDVTGREVRTLVNQEQAPGSYQVEFRSATLKSGVYFYRLEAGGLRLQRKMLFLR